MAYIVGEKQSLLELKVATASTACREATKQTKADKLREAPGSDEQQAT